MTKDEALRLALEALENLGNHDRVCPQWPTYAEPENYPKCNCGYDQAITAIKAALEAKDEPVAWMNKHGHCKTSLFREVEAGAKEEYTIPVYTNPPQRTWVGLMRGVRVDGDTVVISVKGDNDEARKLCGALIEEMNK
jgi:hypothetical protein